MTVTEVVPAFIAVCPTIDLAWQEHLAFWGNESDRGAFNDVGVIAHHLVDCFERGEISEFPAAFALLERCFADGDEQVQELITVGLLEGLQNIASHRPFGSQVFCDWLGPESRSTWNELCEFWEQVAEAKSDGLLEPQTDRPACPPAEASQVQDSALRQIVERLYRR